MCELKTDAGRLAPLPRLAPTYGRPNTAVSARRRSNPVFIVGCPRSGTTLLYDTLLSSGRFAVYRAESDVFYRIAPAFGNLKYRLNRERLLNAWLHSDYFGRTGLNPDEVEEKVLAECRNPGDFIRIFMQAIAQRQRVTRWAEKTPFHILYLRKIKTQVPDALFVHIIRDGRDVAMSLRPLGWTSSFPWDSAHRLAISGLYWKWHVSQGRKAAATLGRDYLEVKYEELVNHPRETLAGLTEFVGEDLSYDRIQRNAIGTVKRPNSSFSRADSRRHVGRWRNLPETELTLLNAVLWPLLSELGYETAKLRGEPPSLTARRLQLFYQLYWSLKRNIKNGPMSRFLVSRERLERGALDRFDSFWEEIRNAD